MGFWDTDYDMLVWLYLPVRRRLLKWYAWLKDLTSQAKYINGLFKTYRANNLYDLSHNGQVCFLEAILNDTFDPVSRGIFITDTAAVDPAWWALDDEEAPEWWALDSESAPAWWPLDSEVAGGSAGFIVHVPVAVVFDTDRMKALINYYKLPTTSYTIVTF